MPDWECQLNVCWQDVGKEKWSRLLIEKVSEIWTGTNKVLASKNEINVVGHRVVHGGNKYLNSTIIDKTVESDIDSFSPLAPLHNEINLDGIRTMGRILPAAIQVAVFDTAFHRTMPLKASLYPVPYEWSQKYNIHKFGFHGINHQYCAKRAAQLIGSPQEDFGLIVCHLGSGSSLAAIQDGKSADTTMGFTPLDGLMMSSRCGSIDPGILIYLLKNTSMTVAELDEALNRRSGLLGISGKTSDMKVIIDLMNAGNEAAKLAFDMYTYRVSKLICEMRAALKRFDALVFTAGVGENAPLVRKSVCSALDFLGISLDDELNSYTTCDGSIESTDSKVKILIINAREDWEIASQCSMLLADVAAKRLQGRCQASP